MADYSAWVLYKPLFADLTERQDSNCPKIGGESEGADSIS
jgi:hypothetical protein